ncbi:MAG: hypothetical protein MJY66_01500 [Bacteroidaceae bacterium]|nr:hypothetical protein [Bacteroidaceae bacterium]
MKKKETPVRKNRITFLASDEEKRIIESYLKKYRIANRSRWMRETLITFIIRKLDQDYPMLFDEQEMRR